LAEALNNFTTFDQLQQLFNESPQPHAFLHPESLQAWFSNRSGSSADNARILTVSDGDRIRCAGVLDPWKLSVCQVPGVSRSRIERPAARLFGKGLLCREGDSTVTAWFNALARFHRRNRIQGTLFEALDRSDWLSPHITNPSADMRLLDLNPVQPHWRVRLPDSVDQYWSEQFSGKTRSTLRRKRRKLGDYEIQVATEPQQVADFLRDASAVSEHTWQTKLLGLRVKNNDQELATYGSMAERNAFRGYLLKLDQQAIAFVICTCHQGYVRYEETGFLPQFSDRSPGSILVSELIDDLIRAGQNHCLDFGLGHADYKQLFANDQSESEDAWLLTDSLQSAIDVTLMNSQQRLTSMGKAVLERTGLLRRVRQLLRRTK
jgi:hypothetical protein